MNLFVFLFLQTPAPIGDALWETIVNVSREISAALPYIALAVLVFAVFFVVARFAARVVQALVVRMRLDPHLASLLGGLTSIAVVCFGIVAAVLVLFPGFNPLQVIAGLSALTVIVSFIFKDLSENFYAGVLILWRKPYRTGDQIKIGEYTGVVEGVTFRSTLLKTLSNERAFIPSSRILAGDLLVKTAYKTRRVQLGVRIGFSDDIETARQTIQRAALETEGVITDTEPLVLVSEFGEWSINFTVYFLAAPDPINVVLVTDRVATNIKYALDKAGIEMPSERRVVLFQDTQERSTDGGGRNAGARRRRAIRFDDGSLPAALSDRRSTEK